MAWFNGYAVLGGLAVVGFSLLHALAFLALKTDGDVRHRARRWFVRLLPVLLLPIAAWALTLQFLAASRGPGQRWLLPCGRRGLPGSSPGAEPKAGRSWPWAPSSSSAARRSSAPCSRWCFPPR